MSNLNGRLKAIEQATARPGAMWYHDKDPLVCFCIHLEKRGIKLTNAEFTELTGLPVPVPLSNPEIEAHLINLALAHDWPDEPESPLDHLVNFFRWHQVKQEVNHLVRLASPDQKRRFSEWADGSGLATRLSKNDGAYLDFWIAGKIIEHYGNEFVQDWIERNEH